jgi:hypothetical protein
VLGGLAVVRDHEAVGAFDVSEMLPQYDVGGGRTARYAAQAILTVVQPRILDGRPAFESDTLDAIFR